MKRFVWVSVLPPRGPVQQARFDRLRLEDMMAYRQTTARPNLVLGRRFEGQDIPRNRLKTALRHRRNALAWWRDACVL